MPYFQKLIELLKIEKAEDQLQYEKQVLHATINEKKLKGLTWYPVVIKGTEFTKGDYINVEFERPTNQNVIHQFRFGSPVVLYSNHDTSDRLEGIVSFQGGNKMKVNFKTEELPDWANDGRLAIEILFDNISYSEMFNSLKAASQENESDLIATLQGIKIPTFKNDTYYEKVENLNATQNAAVEKILKANELAIVHGPPGTGKTTTLVEAIKRCTNLGKILVVAPSNAAVDLLTEKLIEAELNVLRLGNFARVSEKMSEHTMDFKIATHTNYKEIKKWKKQANEYKNMAHKYKRHFGKSEMEQRKALFNEAHKLMKEVENTENYIIEDIIEKTQIFTATLIGSNQYFLKKLQFNTVFIDEAGQCIEPACWVPILKSTKVVLAGDHCQLPPTIKSQKAANMGLSTSLLEKLTLKWPEAVILLDTQYRMNEKIMDFPSKVFYNNKLIAAEGVKNRTIENNPITFYDTAGCGFEERLEGTSSLNPEEAKFLVNRLKEFIEENKIKNESIGVISPYKQQIVILEELTKAENLSQVEVNTIDSFQGQERDIIAISLVRSNSKSEIGFLADIRRMNVAMTRARKKLIIVGDSSTISVLPFYADFIVYVQEKCEYKSAWEFMN